MVDASHTSGFVPTSLDESLVSVLDDKEFSPSRHRTNPVISQRVAAGLQPSKRALPSLLPEGLGTECHLSLALQLVHPFQLPAVLPPQCEFAVNNLQKMKVFDVNTRRTEVAALVQQLAEGCQPSNSQVLEICDPHHQRI